MRFPFTADYMPDPMATEHPYEAPNAQPDRSGYWTFLGIAPTDGILVNFFRTSECFLWLLAIASIATTSIMLLASLPEAFLNDSHIQFGAVWIQVFRPLWDGPLLIGIPAALLALCCRRYRVSRL